MTVVPGSNLLNTALTLIGKQAFFYYRFLSRTVNPNGQDIAVYQPPQKLFASIQPVPRILYDQYGLDLQKHYVMLYASLDLIDIDRDTSGDVIIYKGQMFQFLSDTKWFPQDGWGGVICVRIPLQPLIESVVPPVPNNYTTGNPLVFSLVYSVPVVVSGMPAIDILIGSVEHTANYVSTSSDGTKLLFSYTPTSEDTGSVTLPILTPGTLPILDMANAVSILGPSPDNTPASIAFIAPNMNGITVNVG